MTQEVERCRQALARAQAGAVVSLISSGDPGIYGMAGLALELAEQRTEDRGQRTEDGAPGGLTIEIVPGVTAASAAAAVLGAPLMLDFAVISLSDLLVPWETIRHRLEAVAAADLVVALYNPRSKKRVRQLEETVAIFRTSRAGNTPVGVATAAGQPDQSLVVTDLDHLLDQEVGMRSVVIVGNSTSRIIDGWLVTARGYRLSAVGERPAAAGDRPIADGRSILLLGGTSETGLLALGLAQAGYEVLVSKATEVPLAIPAHVNVEVRSGRLDDDGLAGLIRQRGLRALVDATHPYAVEMHGRARRVAQALGIVYLSFSRPASIDPGAAGVEFAADHEEAAQAAFAHGQAVLLTTGSRHLAPYVAAARRTGLPLMVRVLDHPDSLAACRQAGLADNQILAGRGPFSLAENCRQIKAHGIGVLVTKDSGNAGGTEAKLAAARSEGCRVIVIGRPKVVDNPCPNLEAILHELGQGLC